MRTVWYPLVASWIGTAAYGWTVQYNVNLAVPLILQAALGAAMVCIMSSFQALLIDLHPGRSASAAASVPFPLPSTFPAFPPFAGMILIVVEYREMLVRSRRQCSNATDVDKIECRVDIYCLGFDHSCCQCSGDSRGSKVGHEVAAREGGETSDEEGTETAGYRKR